ncbi:MAG: ABC transporter ATP-binding protein [Planctomyces sp.]|nr:ABC transporter ATP-binding protein [Planctomyces sp.]
MSHAIVCRELVKHYPGKPPVEAVRGLDLEVREGECFGLLGPNGAGKTTTLEILEGLLDPTSGDVRILDREWRTHEQEIREAIGISLQETRFSDKLTVAETVRMFRSFYRAGMAPAEAVDVVSLEEKADAYVVQLSGGQRQRLAVACAIVGDPRLLFLDEPTTGLDPQSRRQLWDIVNSFRSSGRTVMLTTHAMDEAERLCDRVAIVDHGRVIALGTPSQLIGQIGGEHLIDFSLMETSQPLSEDQLQRLPSVRSAHANGGTYRLAVDKPHVALPALLACLQDEGRELSHLTTRHGTLEDVFLSLTGRRLTEDADVVA